MTDMPDLIKHIIEITEEHKKELHELDEQQKKIKLREQRKKAMERYRKNNLEKWRDRAKKLAKAQYERRKSDPEFMKRKCESSKASYHRRKEGETLQD